MPKVVNPEKEETNGRKNRDLIKKERPLGKNVFTVNKI